MQMSNDDVKMTSIKYEDLKKQFLSLRELLVRLNELKVQAELESSRLRSELISSKEESSLEKTTMISHISTITRRNKELLEENESLRAKNATLDFALNSEVDQVVTYLVEDAAAN